MIDLCLPAVSEWSDFDDCHDEEPFCVLLQASLPVRLNMIESNDGPVLSTNAIKTGNPEGSLWRLMRVFGNGGHLGQELLVRTFDDRRDIRSRPLTRVKENERATGIEPTLKFSRLCVIPSQTCATLRVRGENANQASLHESRRITQFQCPTLSEKTIGRFYGSCFGEPSRRARGRQNRF